MRVCAVCVLRVCVACVCGVCVCGVSARPLRLGALTPLTIMLPPATGAAGVKTTLCHVAHSVSDGPQHVCQVAFVCASAAGASSSSEAAATAEVEEARGISLLLYILAH